MIDPYWLTGTTPLWTIIALGYCLASVYLRAFDESDHPPWIWGSFLMIGAGLFLTLNHSYFWPGARFTVYAEYGTITVAIIAGVIMFHLAREYARERETREEMEEILEKYRERLKYYDTADIDPEKNND